MFIRLILLVFLVLFVEFKVFVLSAQWLSQNFSSFDAYFLLFGETVFTSFIGFKTLKNSILNLSQTFTQNRNNHKANLTKPPIFSIFISLLLIFPGILTDILAVVLSTPIVQNFLSKHVLFFLNNLMIKNLNFTYYTQGYRSTSSFENMNKSYVYHDKHKQEPIIDVTEDTKTN